MSQTKGTSSIHVISSDSEEENDASRLNKGGDSSVISSSHTISSSDGDHSPVNKKKRVIQRRRTSTRLKDMASRNASPTNTPQDIPSPTPATQDEDPTDAASAKSLIQPEAALTKSSSKSGVDTEDETGRTGDECSVCLDPPVHPVQLACTHTFCYLCAKGLVMSANAACSLCRQPISAGYLETREILARVSEDLNDTPPVDAPQDQSQWFYEGRNGWWRFEARTNEDLEEKFLTGEMSMELMIVGTIYVIDFSQMEQYQKERPNRKRKIKRDMKSSSCKGVAGLGKNTWKSGTQ